MWQSEEENTMLTKTYIYFSMGMLGFYVLLVDISSAGLMMALYNKDDGAIVIFSLALCATLICTLLSFFSFTRKIEKFFEAKRLIDLRGSQAMFDNMLCEKALQLESDIKKQTQFFAEKT